MKEEAGSWCDGEKGRGVSMRPSVLTFSRTSSASRVAARILKDKFQCIFENLIEGDEGIDERKFFLKSVRESEATNQQVDHLKPLGESLHHCTVLLLCGCYDSSLSCFTKVS